MGVCHLRYAAWCNRMGEGVGANPGGGGGGVDGASMAPSISVIVIESIHLDYIDQ